MRADQMPLEADLREKTQHGTESFPFQYYADALYRYDNQFVPQHWHSELEFVIAYGGEIEIQVWNRPVRLKSGEGILINANVLHSYQQIHLEDQCICPNIVFGDGLIAPIASTVHEKYVDPIIRDGTMPYIALEHGIPWQKEILAHLDIIFSLSQRPVTPPQLQNFLTIVTDASGLPFDGICEQVHKGALSCAVGSQEAIDAGTETDGKIPQGAKVSIVFGQAFNVQFHGLTPVFPVFPLPQG